MPTRNHLNANYCDDCVENEITLHLMSCGDGIEFEIRQENIFSSEKA